MSELDISSNRGNVKTIAIRLEPDLHAQLSLIAQLRRSTITDEIRKALEAHVEAAKTAPELVGNADAALAEIEREAATRREAIATLFGNAPAGPQVESPARPRGRRGQSEG